jgi:hypothetical protein
MGIGGAKDRMMQFCGGFSAPLDYGVIIWQYVSLKKALPPDMGNFFDYAFQISKRVVLGRQKGGYQQ